MALNLAVKEGSAVYIDGEPLRVIAVAPPDLGRESEWVVLVEKKDGTQFELRENRGIEIFPGVYVQLGLKNQFGTASLVFEAPREVIILTEKNFRALQSQANG